MQQVWFLLLCLLVSLVYATLGNTDNRPRSALSSAAFYFAAMAGILLLIAWLLYFLSP